MAIDLGQARGIIDIDIKGFVQGFADAKTAAKEYDEVTKDVTNSTNAVDGALEKSVKGFEDVGKSTSTASQGLDDFNKKVFDAENKLTSSETKLTKSKETMSKFEGQVVLTNKKIAEQKSAIEELEKAISDTNGDTTKYTEKLEKLKTQLNETENKQEIYTKRLLESEQQIERVEQETEYYRQELERTKKETIEAAAENKKYKATVQDVGDSLDKIGSGLKDVGAGLTAGVTAPIIAIGTASFFAADEFEDNFAKVKTIADESIVSFEDLADGVKDLSLEVNKSTSELNDALYQAVSATGDTANALGYVEQSAKLAVGGFTDVTSALDAGTSVMNAYGKTGQEEFQKVADIMITTQNVGKTTVEELASSISGVIPTASAMGVSFEQVGAGLASLTAQGTPTSAAVTQLNSLFAELGKSGTKASDALLEAVEGTEYAGKGFIELSKEGVPLNEILAMLDEQAKKDGLTLLDLFGSIEAGKGALQLVNEEGEKFIIALDAMEESAGATEEAFETMASVQDRLAVIWESLAITIGEILKPYIDEFILTLEKLLEWFTLLDPSMQQTIIVFSLIAAAIGPVLLVIGTLLTSINSLITFVTTMSGALGVLGISFGAILGVFAAVAAAVALLWLAWETDFNNMREKTSEVLNEIQEVITIGLETIQLIWDTIVTAIKTAWENNFLGIQDIATIILDGLFKYIDAWLTIVKNVFLAIQALISGDWEAFWGYVGQVAEGYLDLIYAVISTVIEAIYTLITNAADLIAEAVTNLMKKLFEVISEKWEEIKKVFQDVWDWIIEFLDSDDKLGMLYDAGSRMMTSVLDGLKSAFDTLKEWMNEAIKWITDKLKSWRDAEDEMDSGSGSSGALNGSYANGIDYVPRNGWQAELHEGETVLTREEAERYRSGNSGGSNYTINFYSPKKIDQYEAQKLLDRTLKDINRGLA